MTCDLWPLAPPRDGPGPSGTLASDKEDNPMPKCVTCHKPATVRCVLVPPCPGMSGMFPERLVTADIDSGTGDPLCSDCIAARRADDREHRLDD